MTETHKGILAILAANLIWGVSPIYYKLLDHVPPLEVLSHRTIWSLIFFGLVLIVQRRLGALFSGFATSQGAATILFAALMITCNWFLFIWAIQVGRTVEVSLGHFILPLVSVIFGVVFFAEGLTRSKLIALGLAGAGGLVLTYGLGAVPVVSLILATTFGIYIVIKKRSPIGPVVSVTAEVLCLLPLALIWLVGVHQFGWIGMSGANLGTFGRDLSDSLLLTLSGPLTAGPLILFSYASKRLQMASLGLIQYLNPTLQFAVAVLIFAEPFTRWHGVAFPLIWLALAVYTWDAFRADRAARSAVIAASGRSATENSAESDRSAKP